MYVGKVLTREQTENALSVVDRAFAAEGQGYSRINSNREQVKLGRRMHQMPPALQEAVAVLEAHWLRADPAGGGAAGGGEMPPLMDVYALRTAQDESKARQPWTARFRCTLVLAWPDGHDEVFAGKVNGTLVWPMRGEQGHGYDPMFQPDGHEVTFAEMDAEQKNSISHRADAFAKLIAGCFG